MKGGMDFMELGNHIKHYRNEKGLSQEELAERVYVTRQTISNWENNKNYPDINSIVLLSEVFEISIDNLIKGDLEQMKREIYRKNLTLSGIFFKLNPLFL